MFSTKKVYKNQVILTFIYNKYRTLVLIDVVIAFLYEKVTFDKHAQLVPLIAK